MAKLTFFRRLKEALSVLYDGGHPRDPGVARLFGLGQKTAAGVAVDEDRALQVSAVYAAVRLISETIASLPLCVFKSRATGGKDKQPDHWAYGLLHDAFNDEMSSFTARETMAAHVLLWGNAYAEIEWRGDGSARALWPLEPWRVVAKRDTGHRLVYAVDGQRTIAARDLVHIPGLGFDGILGKSVIGWARESLGLTLAAQEFGATHFGNGTVPGGFLEHPGRMTQQAIDNLVTSFEKRHQSAKNAHKVGILSEGMKFHQLKMSPEDSQFLQTRQFQIEEVARWFNVPPHLLRDLTRATFANIEEQGIEFVVYTLRPWLVRWEQELNRKLLGGGLFVRHNIDGLLRGNSAAQSAFYREMFGIGALSVNDVLELMDRNPIGAAGDLHFVPVNMAPIDSYLPSNGATNDENQADGQGTQDGQSNQAGEEYQSPQALRGAVARCVTDTLARMFRKECKAVSAAARRPDTFLAWLDEFYPRHAQLIATALAPALGQGRASAIARHCETFSREALLDAAGQATAAEFAARIDALLAGWDGRAQLTANLFLKNWGLEDDCKSIAA